VKSRSVERGKQAASLASNPISEMLSRIFMGLFNGVLIALPRRLG
jgi:hypothetical protein